MTGGPLAAFITGDLLIIATGVLVWWLPRRDALVVRRSAERPAPVLSGRLVPSHRALPGRPSAAGTAAPVYRITDLPAATGARANREGTAMGSGFTGSEGRRPPVHARPPDSPYTLDQLQAASRILGAELGYGWKVEVEERPEGPRLVVEKSLSHDGPLIVAATLKEARHRVAEYIRENR